MINGTVEAFLGRLPVPGKAGKMGKAALVALTGGVRADLAPSRNPVAPIYRRPDGATDQRGGGAGFVLAKDGHGRVFYGDRPIRGMGKPVVEGFGVP